MILSSCGPTGYSYTFLIYLETTSTRSGIRCYWALPCSWFGVRSVSLQILTPENRGCSLANLCSFRIVLPSSWLPIQLTIISIPTLYRQVEHHISVSMLLYPTPKSCSHESQLHFFRILTDAVKLRTYSKPHFLMILSGRLTFIYPCFTAILTAI